MRYEDASQTDSLSNELPVARDDADALAAGDRGPATGNVITGEGTQTGTLGTDALTAGAQVTSIDGAGGTDAEFSGGKLNVTGEFGKLSVDAQGNYSYLANQGAPETARDHFSYRLTDAEGNSDTARLTIEIGKTQAQVATQQVVVGPDGVVVLPAGVTLNDIRVVGRDLVVTLPDGSQMVIVDGAVFVPQLVLDNVEIPATNLAALLIDSEPRPAAGGEPPSSGGNFEVPVGPLDPGVPLGDLIPPTELDYTPPDFIDVGIDVENRAPFASDDEINVSDEGLEAGIADTAGTPDTTNSATASGSILAGDEDGDDLTITLGFPDPDVDLFSHGVAITWALSAGGTVLTGSAGATTVIVLTMDSDGDYTVVQSAPIDHPNGSIEDGVSFLVPVNVSDGEESVDVAITVTIEDDSPSVSNVRGESSVLLDETDGANPLSSGDPIEATSEDAMIAADVSIGADGDGPPPVYGLSLLGGVTSLLSNVQTALGDFPITLTLTSSTLITATYNDGDSIETAFTIEMNPDGTVTVTQHTALEHLVDGPPGPAHDDALTLSSEALGNLVNATIVYEDFDGDTVSASTGIGDAITFEDDGPSIEIVATIPTDQEGPSPLVMTTFDDGTEGGGSTTDSTTADFGGVFSLGTSDGGADGAAGTPDIAYSLNLLVAEGSDSNLDSNGDTIFLYNIGGVVIGSTSAVEPASATDASVVFALSVNGDGEVTLTQYQQIDHPLQAAPNAAPFADQFAVLGSELVELVATANIVDNDGDTDSDSESIDLGGYVRFADDGPDIDAALVAEARIRIDETDNVAAAGGEIDGPGGNLGTVTMDLGTLFTVSNVGVSADAPTVNSYALTLGAAVEGLVDSGLLLSTTNDPIYLYFVGTTVVGSTALTAPVSLDDPSIAFTVSINADGDVTLTQFLAIEHPIPGDSHDEDSSGLLAGALNVSVTATDFDGDTDTDSVDLGSIIRFEDDGPSVDVTANATLEPTITLTTGDAGTEAGGSTSDFTTSGNFGGVFGLTFTTGSDGATTPSLTFTLGTPGGPSGLESHDLPIFLYDVDGVIVGSTSAVEPATATDASVVFAVSVSTSGVVTLTQYQQIDHPLQAAPNAAPFADQLTSLLDASVTLTASSTITDNDLDTDSDEVTVNIGANLRFADDGPVIESGPVITSEVVLDETDFDIQIPLGFPITDTSDDPIITAPLNGVDYGADGEGPEPEPEFGLSLLKDGTNDIGIGESRPSGLNTVDGLPITLTLTSETLITATYQDGGTQTAFTIQMNDDGTITVTQNVPLEHVPGDHDDALDLDNALGNLVNATVVYTDFDGDTATATVPIGAAIIFKDDGPDAATADVTTDTLVLDESPADEDEGPGDFEPAGLATITADFSDNFADPDYGADGEGSVGYALILDGEDVPSGLFALGVNGAQGAAILLNQDDVTGVITGSVGDDDYFTISVDAETGVVTFTQLANVYHDNTDSDDDTSFLNVAEGVLVIEQTVTDADGDTDSATVDLGDDKFQIEDDGPSVTDEPERDVNEGATAIGKFDFDAGTDGGGVTHVNGIALVFDVVGGFSDPIDIGPGSIIVKANGDYSFTAENPAANGPVDGTFTVTDADGDTETGDFTFDIVDVNQPTAGESVARVDDDGLVGSPDGDLEVGNGDINADASPPEAAPIDPSEAVFHGQLTLNFGGDGAGSVTFAAMDGQPGMVGTESVLYAYSSVGGIGTLTATIDGGDRNGEPLFTVVLDEATGEYTLTLDNNVLHVAGGDDETSADLVPLTYTVTDSDNSPAGGVDGTLNVTFNDDTPELDVTAVEEEGIVLTTQDAETDGDPTTQDFDDTAVDFDGVFNLSFDAGADGVKGDAPELNYDLNVLVQNSGLRSHGQIINLFEVGGVVFGTTAGVAPASAATPGVVFSLAVSPAGVVTLTQYQQVDHEVEVSPVPGTDAPFDDQFATLVDGKITLTGSATVTDGDDDVASDDVVVDLGGNIRFADDGPIADDDNIAQATENTAVEIDVFANDEGGADGVDLETGVELVPGSLSGSGELVYNLDGTFTYTPVAGEDADITFQYQITDFDGDTDIATATIDLQPDSVPQATAEVAFVDDDGLLGNNPNANVNDINANLGGDGDSNANESIWSGVLNATFGADTPGTFTFNEVALEALPPTTVGQETVTYVVSNGGLTLTAMIATSPDSTREDTPLFTVQITNTNTGAYTVTLDNNVLHDTLNTLAGDDTENPTDPTVVIPFTATDSDTTDSTTANLTITFDDDMASINDVTTTLNIENDATPSETGIFDFTIGADNNTDFDDITVSNFTILVNGIAATNVVFTPDVDAAGDPSPESAGSASYGFSFDYDTGDGGTATAEGTLVFDKDAGEYTVTLTNGPIEAFSIASVQGGQDPIFHDYPLPPAGPGGDVDNGIAVVEIADDFFIQFTGQEDVTGSSGTFGHDETFGGGSQSEVKISSTNIGVFGNSVQDSDALDYNFYSSDPGAALGPPTTSAGTAFIQVAQFNPNGGEDFIVVLKLADPNTPGTFITRTIVVETSDVLLVAPAGYPTLGNGGGLIIIEPNDYIGLTDVPDNYEIVGMQLRSSTEGLGSEANEIYNFDGDLGQADSSTTTFSATTTDNDVFKIFDIGVVRSSPEDQSATIGFDVTIEDADGDSATTSITVQIGDPPAALAASTMAFSQEPANDTSSMSLLSTESGDQQLQKTAANNNTGVVAAAVAAAGFASTQAAAHSDGQDARAEVTAFDMQQGQSIRSLANDNDVAVDGGRSLLSNESRVAVDDAGVPSGTASFDVQGTGQLVDDMSSFSAALTELSIGTDAPASDAAAASMVAPMIVMPSVEGLEMLSANGSADGHRNSVVEKVIADALEGGGGGGDIDALLAGLAGGGNGENAALDALASQSGGAVPVWDMGNGGSFQADILMKIVTDAIELHHDAVQPAING